MGRLQKVFPHFFVNFKTPQNPEKSRQTAIFRLLALQKYPVRFSRQTGYFFAEKKPANAGQ